MNETLACPQDHGAVDAATGQCAVCGTALFSWTDGQSQPWRIEATPAELRLRALGVAHLLEESCVIVERGRWRRAITFAPLGSRVVIHFDTGKREIGFSVPQEEAKRLFQAMAAENASTEAPAAALESPALSARPVHRKDSPAWPKMTAATLAAFIGSCLAVLPVAGLPFAILAVIMAIVALRRARPNASFSHVRWMARASLIIAAVGAVIGSLAAWSVWGDLQVIGFDGLVMLADLRVAGDDIEWSWGARIAAFVMVIIALSIHEASHAISSWWSGDGLARSLGRVTLNPLSHIDPFGTVLLPLMLTLAHAPVFGYARPVPTQLGHVPKPWRAQALVAAAGPVSNMLQALVCLGALLLMGMVLRYAAPDAKISHFSSYWPIVEIEGIPGGRVLAGVALLLKLGFQINVMLAFFNLIPVPPLDGSWIAQYFAPRFVGRVYEWLRPYGFVVFIVLLWSGVLWELMTPGYMVMLAGHRLLAMVTGM